MKSTRYTNEQRRTIRQQGFTIVELMIATVVFSLVLTVIIYGVLSFSRSYYGGINTSTTQNTTRNVMNSITQAIEFSGNTIAPSVQMASGIYCFSAGGESYYFDMGVEYDGATPSSGDPGIYMVPGSCSSTPSFSGGTELLGPKLRVTYLSVQQASNPRLYIVGLALAYGDADLLCNVTKNAQPSGGCLPGSTVNAPNSSVIGAGLTPLTDVQCGQITGFQFCSHASLSATVSLRVANSALN